MWIPWGIWRLLLTNADDENICDKGLDGDIICRDHSEVMPINPEFVGRQACTADYAELVCFPFLKLNPVALSWWAYTVWTTGWVTPKHSFTVQESSSGVVSVVGNLFVEVTEGIRVIPICNEEWFNIDVVVCAGRTVDHDRTASTIGIYMID